MRLSALFRTLRIEEPENVVPPDRVHRRNHRESLLNSPNANPAPGDAPGRNHSPRL